MRLRGAYAFAFLLLILPVASHAQDHIPRPTNRFYLETDLTADIASGTSASVGSPMTVTVASTSNFADTGNDQIMICDLRAETCELMRYTSKAATTFSVVERGMSDEGAQDFDADDPLVIVTTGANGYTLQELIDRITTGKTAAPGATDDGPDGGFEVGSIWVDETNDKAYVALDVSDDAAVWTEITGAGGGGLSDVVDDTTPQLGGELDAQGNNIIDLGDVTFQTGASGGTLRTGTSASDKFQLQAYDTNGTSYTTLLQADAGTEPIMQLFVDHFHFEDATDPTKILDFDLSGATTGTTTTFVFGGSGARNITFPDATTTLVGNDTTDTLTNKTLTSPVLNTSVSGTAVLDEDTMSSDSATKLATQQSIKAYVDANAGGTDRIALTFSTGSTNLNGGETQRMGLGVKSSGLDNVEIIVPVAGTITAYYGGSGGAAGSSESYTHTVTLDGSDQSMTCTISGVSATSCNDTSNTFAVSAGDRLSIKIVASASTAANTQQGTLLLEPS